jgi:hypothetical protein
MPQIESIQANIQTLDVSGAGTDGDVYLGVSGREFHLDTSHDDFERGSSRKYVLGDGGNINNASINDPRKQFLLTEDVESFPVYLRFNPQSGSDNWNLERAVVTFNNELLPQWDTLTLVKQNEGIWLGTHSGLVVFIPKHEDTIP